MQLRICGDSLATAVSSFNGVAIPSTVPFEVVILCYTGRTPGDVYVCESVYGGGGEGHLPLGRKAE